MSAAPTAPPTAAALDASVRLATADGATGGAGGALREQFRWAVRIRWLAIAGFLLLGMAGWLTGVLVDPVPCAVAAAAASLLNVANGAAVRRWRWVGVATTAAVAGDVLLISFLVARTGGLRSPFLAMYAVQVLAAALLVEVRVALACAAAAAAAVATAVAAGAGAGDGSGLAVAAPAFLPVWVVFFGFGLGLVAWVGGHVSRRLRRRERALEVANGELRAALDRVEEGNRELRATCERLEQTERRLAQSEKMRALGDFVAGVAHELNNPIAIVAANLELLEAEAAGGGAADPQLNGEALRDCREAARRAARIVADLRRFARAGDAPSHDQAPGGALGRGGEDEGAAPRFRELDLNRAVARTVRLARHLFGRGVEIDLDLGELPPVRVVAAEIDQLLLNLLANAARAVGDSGRVRVSTRVARLARLGRQARQARQAGETPGAERRSVVLAVADDGPGVPAAVRNRIFDPFFTTRPEGQGVGLGLSLAFAIAERHGGSIQLVDNGEPGACFEVTLPAAGAN